MTFGTSIIILVINILGGILTARLLGPLGKGQLTAVTLWPAVLAALGNLGLVESIVYYIGKENGNNVKNVWSGALLLAIFQSITLIFLGYIFLPVLMYQYSSSFIRIARYYLLFIPLNILTLYGIAIFQGRLLMGLYNLVRLLVTCSYLVGVLILALFNKLTVEYCVAILLLSNTIVLGFELYWLRKFGWLMIGTNFKYIRKMITFGLKAHIGNISSLLNSRMDQMVMAIVLEPELLGLYVVAVTISGGVNIATSAIAIVTFPTLSNQKSIVRQKKVFTRLIRLTFWSSLTIAIFLLSVTGLLITILFGEDFTPAIPSARVLIFAAIMSGMNTTLASGLRGFGKPSIPSLGELISLAFTGVMLLLLLPKWNILGAAMASLLAYSANFLFMYLYVWWKLSIPPQKAVFPQPEDWLFVKLLIKKYKNGVSA